MNTNKKITRLTESKLKSIIDETIKKVLKESTMFTIKEPYYNLTNAIENFIEVFEETYNMEDEKYVELVNLLKQTQNAIDDFVQHPEGRGQDKMWDSLGFYLTYK